MKTRQETSQRWAQDPEQECQEGGGTSNTEEDPDFAENWTQRESKITNSEAMTWQASNAMANAYDYGSEDVTWIGMLAAASILLSSLKQFEMTTATCMGFPWNFPWKTAKTGSVKGFEDTRMS